MAKKRLHGIEDVSKGKSVSETMFENRRLGEMIFGLFTGAMTPLYVRVTCLLMFIAGLLIGNAVIELIAVALFLLMWPFSLMSKKKQMPVHHIPKHLAGIIKVDPMTGKAPAGEIFCGIERLTGRQIWLSHDEDNRHTSVFGGTGSGKTEFFVSTVFHYLTLGSGVFSVDPKGDVKFPHQLSKMARRLGRDHDMTLISYITRDTVAKDGFPLPRQTNRITPISGDWATERELMFDLMPAAEGNNASFIENAKILIEVHLRAISALYEAGHLTPSIKRLGMYVNNLNYLFAYLGKGPPLESDDVPAHAYEELGKNPTFRESVERFITAINGDPNGTWEEHQKSEEFRRQGGFVISNTMKVINTFSVGFENIFNTPASDVTYIELLRERRIHAELLPSLTKARDTTKLLGRLATSGMKQAIAANIPAQLEGASDAVLDSLPSASRSLFPLILDEYGAISSEQAELLFTQGRSFNVAAKMGTQDKQGGEGATESEKKVFKQILNNSYVTFGMRVDDPEDTGQFLIKKGHKTHVNVNEGHEINGGLGFGTELKGQSRYSEVEIVDSRDLAQQEVGEAHVYFGGNIIRAKTPYANLDLSSNSSLILNRFVLFGIPSYLDLYEHASTFDTFKKKLKKVDSPKFLQSINVSKQVQQLQEKRSNLIHKLIDIVNVNKDVLINGFGSFIYLHYQTMSSSDIDTDARIANYERIESKAIYRDPETDINKEVPIASSSIDDQGEYELNFIEPTEEFEFVNTPLALQQHYAKLNEEHKQKLHEKGLPDTDLKLEEADFSPIIKDPSHQMTLENPEIGVLMGLMSSGEDSAMRIVEETSLANKDEQYEEHDPESVYIDGINAAYSEREKKAILTNTGDSEKQLEAAGSTTPETPKGVVKSRRAGGRPPRQRPEDLFREGINTDLILGSLKQDDGEPLQADADKGVLNDTVLEPENATESSNTFVADEHTNPSVIKHDDEPIKADLNIADNDD